MARRQCGGLDWGRGYECGEGGGVVEGGDYGEEGE